MAGHDDHGGVWRNVDRAAAELDLQQTARDPYGQDLLIVVGFDCSVESGSLTQGRLGSDGSDGVGPSEWVVDIEFDVDEIAGLDRWADPPPVLWPSTLGTSGGTPNLEFRGSIARPARALSTLRHALAERRRMTRGRRGSLALRRGALPSPPPSRVIPALSPNLVDTLNTALRDLTGRHGVVVADIHHRFLGHRVRAGDPATPDSRPTDRNLWYCGVIEPNAWGADAIRAAWWQALHDGG